MAQANYWSNPDSLAARLRNANYGKGYSTAPPTYNMNSSQRYFNPDEIRNSVNSWWANRQMSTQTFTMPQQIQAADYRGQPISVPANAPSQFVEDVAKPVGAWLAAQIAQNAAIRGLTGNSLGGWTGVIVPRAAGAIAGSQLVNSSPVMSRAVDFGRQVVATPAAQKLGNIAKTALDWVF